MYGTAHAENEQESETANVEQRNVPGYTVNYNMVTHQIS
jgi:hypothetical protein